MTLTTLAPGVHAWVQSDGSWFLNNAGAVHHGDDVVLIDTCATATRTRRLLHAVEEATGSAAIRFAVNTHWHGDHCFGNALLPDSTVLVGHEHTRGGILADDMLTTALPPIWSPVPHWGVTRTRAPSVVLRGELTLYAGDHRIDLHAPGHPAHTHGDVVAWLPEQRVLFTGDLLFHHVTPLVLQGTLDGAVRATDWLRGFHPVHTVPGHGPVITANEWDAALDAQIRYYRLVQRAAAAGIGAGHSPLEAARRCDLGEFAVWPDHQRIVLNLHRAYADALSRPMDLFHAFTDATTYNGGPLHCTA